MTVKYLVKGVVTDDATVTKIEIVSGSKMLLTTPTEEKIIRVQEFVSAV